jgi:hypothetical protein
MAVLAFADFNYPRSCSLGNCISFHVSAYLNFCTHGNNCWFRIKRAQCNDIQHQFSNLQITTAIRLLVTYYFKISYLSYYQICYVYKALWSNSRRFLMIPCISVHRCSPRKTLADSQKLAGHVAKFNSLWVNRLTTSFETYLRVLRQLRPRDSDFLRLELKR